MGTVVVAYCNVATAVVLASKAFHANTTDTAGADQLPKAQRMSKRTLQASLQPNS